MLGASIWVDAMVAAGSCIASIACLAWWLAGRFRAVENIARETLDAHEEKDQLRHEENLKRFGDISVRLAEMRRNGHYQEKRRKVSRRN